MPTLNSAVVTGNDVALTWTHTTVQAVTDPNCPAASRINYEVVRRLNGNTTWIVHATIAASATAYTANVVDGQWDFAIRAVERGYVFFDGSPSYCQPVDSRPISGVLTRTVGNDTTPDTFTFTDQTDRGTATSYTSNTITVSGINAATTIDVSTYTGGINWRKNGGPWQSSAGTVVNGDTVQLRMTASSQFDTSVSVTCDIGGITDVWTLTTQSPGGQVVMPTSGTISYNMIRGMWGPRPDVNVNMYDWRKNGPYWQDHPENASVPTDHPISLSDFYGCKGIWEVDTLPSNLGSSSTSSISYTLSSPTPNVALEYRWEVVETDPGRTSSSSHVGTWSVDNTNIQVSMTGGTNFTTYATASLYARPFGTSENVFIGSIAITVGDGGPPL